MIEIIQRILGAPVIVFTNIFVLSGFFDKKINLRNLKNVILIFVLICFTLMNYYFNNQFFRIVTTTVLTSIFFKIMFNEKITKVILGVITIQMIYMISELVFVFCLLIFDINPENFVTMFGGHLLTNAFEACFVIFFTKLKFVKKFYNFLINITDKIKSGISVSLLFILMLAANVYAEIMYHEINFMYMMIFNVGLTILCFFIIMNSFKIKDKYLKVYDKYNTTLNSLREYEDILDKYRISNHENKNQLLTIRNIVPKNNKKLISYIDQIIENKLKDNEKILLSVSKIPAGGLKGLIYSKILLMEELNIKYDLNFSKQIKTVDLIKIDDVLMLDVCNIVGVFLDNSIEAVNSLRKKYIMIDFYMEKDELYIKIANNYAGKIEIEKLESTKYTTKEKGHGYGLALAKQIIDNNSKLENQKEINKELFTQILKIKIK